MRTDMEKLAERHQNEKNPVVRAKLKSEMDQIPVTSGELSQAMEREHDRKEADIREYRKQRGQ